MSSFMETDVHLSVVTQALFVRGAFHPSKLDNVWVELKWLNMQALNARYSDELPHIRDIECDRTSVESPLALFPTVLACASWLYQCTEGDHITSHPTFQAVHTMLADLAAELGYPKMRALVDAAPRDAPGWTVTDWSQVITDNPKESLPCSTWTSSTTPALSVAAPASG